MFIYMCVCTHLRVMVQVLEVREQLGGFSPPTPECVSRRLNSGRLGGKCHYLLSHLISNSLSSLLSPNLSLSLSWRQGLSMTWNLLGRPGWPPTHSLCLLPTR